MRCYENAKSFDIMLTRLYNFSLHVCADLVNCIISKLKYLHAYRTLISVRKMDKWHYKTGTGCSKLTTSLVIKVSLNLHRYFLLKKCENLLHCKRFSNFPTKNINVFDKVVSVYLTSRRLHDVFKLTML